MKTEGDHSIHPSVVTQEIPNDWREIDIKIPGLTKREYFAAMALQGFIASCDWNTMKAGRQHAIDTAGYAVQYADHLMDALNSLENQSI